MGFDAFPGLAGLQASQQMRAQRDAHEMQQATGLMALMQHAQAQQREQAFRSGIDALGPNPTQESLAQLSARFASPKDVLETQQKSLDRKAVTEATAATNAARLAAQAEAVTGRLAQQAQFAEQTHEFRMSRLESDKDKSAEVARHNQVIEGLTTQKNKVDEQLRRMGLDIQGAMVGVRRDALAQANKPPSGYRPTPGGNLEAIPGGPADTKLQGALNADTGMLNESTSNMDRLATVANELKEHPGLGSITGVRGAIPNIPGTQAANAQALLDTLKSQVGFGVLQNMRNNSKTGGALGQVSNIEEKLLQDNLAALGKAQSKEEFQKQLQKIIDYTGGAKDRIRSAYNLKHGGPSSTSVPEFADEAAASAAGLKPGTRVKIGGQIGTWH